MIFEKIQFREIIYIILFKFIGMTIYNNISLVMMGNDKLFLEKAVKKAAEDIDIPVVIIQHGIYLESSFAKGRAASSARYFWAWSKYVAEIYQKIYRNNARIDIIGYLHL